MTASQVNQFFSAYAAAFSAAEVDALTRMWQLPALMAFDGRQVMLDEPEFRSNLLKLCAFYRAQGMVTAQKEVLELHPLTPTTASVRTLDKLYDRADGIIAQWEHAYLLSQTAAGIRLAAALPDNELRAWRERGTPLGGDATSRFSEEARHRDQTS